MKTATQLKLSKCSEPIKLTRMTARLLKLLVAVTAAVVMSFALATSFSSKQPGSKKVLTRFLNENPLPVSKHWKLDPSRLKQRYKPRTLLHPRPVGSPLPDSPSLNVASRAASSHRSLGSVPHIRQAIAEQERFCREEYPKIRRSPPPEWTLLTGLSIYGSGFFDMYIYKVGDIVSNDILWKGAWDINKVEQIEAGMNKYRMHNNLTTSQTVFLDVGANIGWFSLVIAALGYSVVAVEPMQANVRMLRSSLCENEKVLRGSVTLLPLGLGERPAKCISMSTADNQGDGVTSCRCAALILHLPVHAAHASDTPLHGL